VVSIPDTREPVTSPTTSVHKEPDNDNMPQLPPNKKGKIPDRSVSEYSFRSRKRSKSKLTWEKWGKTN
jgi:hypothetical protein